jgi:outer membrane immunogenic protein
VKNTLAKLTAVAIASSFVALSGAALADGMPGRSLKDAPAAAPFSWSGFYVGGSFGANWVDGANYSSAPADATTQAFTNPFIAAGLVPTRGTSSGTGAIGGLQSGYNWQSGGLVFGFETDLSGSTAGASQEIVTNIAPGVQFGRFTGTTSVQYIGTVRLRMGALLSPTMLAYVTGGFAYGGVERTAGANLSIVTGQAFGRSQDINTGWALGGGLEWALSPRVTLGAEYLYVNLDGGSFNTTNVSGICGAASICNFRVNGSDIDNHVARVKFNFKL